MRRLLWLVVGLGLLALGGDITALSQIQLLGACCAAIGLMVIAAELGYRAGLRQT